VPVNTKQSFCEILLIFLMIYSDLTKDFNYCKGCGNIETLVVNLIFYVCELLIVCILNLDITNT